MLIHSAGEGSKRVTVTWRATSARPCQQEEEEARNAESSRGNEDEDDDESGGGGRGGGRGRGGRGRGRGFGIRGGRKKVVGKARKKISGRG
jgi:hypothetical protein